MSLTKATYSMIDGASLNVLDYGAVADGNFSGGSPSGTDNYAAFAAALAAAVTTGVNAVYVPAGIYYISAGLTLPRGVTLFGVGTAHMPVWTSGSNRRGTVLLIAAANGGDCITYDSTLNSGHSVLRSITIAHVGSTTNRSVVYIANHLYPIMEDVELFSLVTSTGSGLYLYGSTLWGNFDNVIAVCQSPSSFRYGLRVYGVDPVTVANANSFRAGHFVGMWAGAYFDGAAGDTGALSIAFHGVKFDLNWDGTEVPTFVANGTGLYDYPAGSVYIVPVVQINKGVNLAFHGCYFEAAGEPATFDDGVNGTHDLIPVIANTGAYAVRTGIFDCNWNNVYPFDTGEFTLIDPTTAAYRHSSRRIPVLTARQATPQSIPNNTWTAVNFDTVLFGDTSHLKYDPATDAVIATTDGTYLVTAQVGYDGWATASTVARMRVFLSTGVNFLGEIKPQQGAGIAITIQQSCVVNLSAGDTITIETLHTQGGPQNTAANFSVVSVVQI